MEQFFYRDIYRDRRRFLRESLKNLHAKFEVP